ncbi:MAG: hypothetical protein EAX81_03695 [Candidatus Thorarchaeota archaeon]|nr:hypothetical protein [Candidatus Thorarchaeota archaeon]
MIDSVDEFKEFVGLFGRSGTRKAAIAAMKSLPNKERGSSDIGKMAGVTSADAKKTVTKLKSIGIVHDTPSRRFRASRSIGWTDNLIRQLSTLPLEQQEKLIYYAILAQKESISDTAKFWRTRGNTTKWLNEWGQARPRLSFGMKYIPASMAADVAKVMERFEKDLSATITQKETAMGEGEVDEPLLLLQWLVVPTG